ncbi:hypothetical protein ACS0TY_020116 [Phlomoides rotata]
MDETIDIPQYFLCPISLQIMKDPVTTVTGITYDRESIQQWLNTTAAAAPVLCPVTKQPLSRPADLTPNHMLRRLIQAWCVANAQSGVDRIPTPRSPLQRSVVIKLIREVSNKNNILLNLEALKKLEKLAEEENDKNNQKCMAENGVAKSMIQFVSRCFKNVRFLGLDHAFRILRLTWFPSEENKRTVEENPDFFQSVLWVLNSGSENTVKTDALIALKNVAGVASSASTERLNPSFFKEIIKFLKMNITPQATKAILKILIEVCPPGRNKMKIVEAGAVSDLIEMELSKPEKKTTELIFCLLAHLCSCADGRQQFLRHAGGVAVVAKRLLRVSPATDDRALCILESIARFSATRGVVLEILAMGGVSKLCMVLQADCEGYLKKKARAILRLHSKAWSDSPCIQLYLFTRYT